MHIEDYITSKQVGELIDRNRCTVYIYIKKNLLPEYSITAKDLKIRTWGGSCCHFWVKKDVLKCIPEVLKYQKLNTQGRNGSTLNRICYKKPIETDSQKAISNAFNMCIN
jgi:hypothetical protein